MRQKLYDVVSTLPWSIQKGIVDASDFVKSPKLCMENRRQIRQFFKETADIYEIDDNRLSSEDKKLWEKALLYYAISSPRAARKIADNFCRCRLRCLKQTEDKELRSPVFLCVVKDDLKRIQMSYQHHKQLGIRNFVFIDNGSTDGTMEWLLEQPVTVYQTLDKFIMWAKVAWISKVINHYGFDRWYLIVDSDELFVYPDCEAYSIDAYISHLEKNKRKRDLSFMLDMYSEHTLFEKAADGRAVREEYNYFDSDSYRMENCLHYKKIVGGPRQRVFAKQDSLEMLQNKYPLVFYQRGDVYRYHYVAPYRDNFPANCTSALLHFKFLSGDYEKYVKIANDGNYANGSRLYKDIVEKLEHSDAVSFYNDKSVKYEDSKDLLKNRLINDWK
jgi:hypothetical protein